MPPGPPNLCDRVGGAGGKQGGDKPLVDLPAAVDGFPRGARGEHHPQEASAVRARDLGLVNPDELDRPELPGEPQDTAGADLALPERGGDLYLVSRHAEDRDDRDLDDGQPAAEDPDK